MAEYNYLNAVIDDVRRCIDEYDARGEDESRGDYKGRLYDEMFIDDSITGNGSGSYTFSTAKAKEYVLSDFDTVADAYHDYGMGLGKDLAEKNWERLDVIARCYCLGEALDVVLDEMGVK